SDIEQHGIEGDPADADKQVPLQFQGGVVISEERCHHQYQRSGNGQNMQGQQAFALWSVCPDGTHNAMREHRKRNGCGGEQQSPQTVFKLGTAGSGGGRHNDRDRHNDGEKKWQFPAQCLKRINVPIEVGVPQASLASHVMNKGQQEGDQGGGSQAVGQGGEKLVAFHQQKGSNGESQYPRQCQQEAIGECIQSKFNTIMTHNPKMLTVGVQVALNDTALDQQQRQKRDQESDAAATLLNRLTDGNSEILET